MSDKETALPVSEAYDALIGQASADPAAALASWEARFGPEASGPYASFHRSGFERLAKIIEAGARLPGGVAEALASARALFQAATDPHEAAREAFALSFAKGLRDADAKTPAPAVPLSELDDVVALERSSSLWISTDWIAWLHHGLAALHNSDPLAHLAFPPIQLFPGDRVLEQLAAALMEGADQQLRPAALLRSAILTDLQGRPDAMVCNPVVDADLWRLLSLMGPGTQTIAVARSYLEWLQDDPENRGPEIVAAVCSTVANVEPKSSAQATFFIWLRKQTPLWRPEYGAFLKACLNQHEWTDGWAEEAGEATESARKISGAKSGRPPRKEMELPTVPMPRPERLSEHLNLAQLETQVGEMA